MSAINGLSATLGFLIGFCGTMWGLSVGWSNARAMATSVAFAFAFLFLAHAATT